MGEPGLLKLDFSHYIKSAPATVIRCCKIKTLSNAFKAYAGITAWFKVQDNDE